MPVKVANGLPAVEILQEENVFVMTESRAQSQDIRPLKIAIMNIMPTKIKTETQLLRMLSNSPLQIDVTLLHPKSHVSKNTPLEHLQNFYKTFDEIKNEKYDGLIITGAPVEMEEFHNVNYWEELSAMMDWSVHNVFSTIHICWGAQAGLYHHYGVPKYILPKKCFGIFPVTITDKKSPLYHGFDEGYMMPHSRHTECRHEDIDKVPELQVIADSPDGAGLCVIQARDYRQIFIFGHGEYDATSLADEYWRDVNKGLDIDKPVNYFKNDDPEQGPEVKWQAYANLLFSNWLNYCVYQKTPYDLNAID